MSERVCRVCGQADTRTFTRRGHETTHCRCCDYVWAAPLATSVDYVKLYGPEYYGAGHGEPGTISRYDLGNIEPSKRAQARWSLRLIARHKPAGRLLDAGCSAGVFAAAARDAGYAVSAFDVSAIAVQFARERFGLDAQVAALETADFPAASFDVITLWDVIEHTEDPWQAWRRIAGWLAPGGVIAVRTPNTRCLRVRLRGLDHWDMVSPPEHWHLFSACSLRLFLKQTGFRLLTLRTVHSDRVFYRQTPRWRQLPFWISAACGWGGDLAAVAARQP